MIFNDRTITVLSEYEWLGMVVDECLTFNQHSSSVLTNLRGKIRTFNNILSKYSNVSIFVLCSIYVASFLPITFYCLPLWYNISSNLKKSKEIRVEVDKLIRKINGTHSRTSRLYNYVELGVLELEQLVIDQSLSFVKRVYDFDPLHRIHDQFNICLNDNDFCSRTRFWKYSLIHLDAICAENNISRIDFLNLSKSTCKRLTKDFARSKLQSKWDLKCNHKLLYSIKPSVEHNKIWDKGSRECSLILAQLRSGFDFLNHTTGTYNWTQFFCENCGVIEDLEHFFFDCYRFTLER